MANACATAASSIQGTALGIASGQYEVGIAVGADKHPRGAFTADPKSMGLADWYGEDGQFLTTKFFGMKANRYIHEHNISQRTLAKIAAKNYRNGGLNPNAFRRTAIDEDKILNSQMLNYPLTQYMFCAPDEGAAAVVMCRADLASKYTDKKPVYVRAVEIRTRRYGAYEVHATYSAVDEDVGPDRLRVQGGLREGRYRARRCRRHPGAGHRRGRRADPHGRERVLRRR